MKTIRIYLDTSVIGGCFDKEFEKYSNLLINEILAGKKQGVISDITVKELVSAPEQVTDFFERIFSHLEVLQPLEEINNLADIYLDENIVSEKYYEDLLHIAYATVYQLDILTSWNFKHIVNYQKINSINAANIKNGYKMLAIYPPMEVIENEEE